MASERQVNSLSGLLAAKMIQRQISLTNRLTYRSTTLTNSSRQWRTRANHRRLMSGPPLMRGMNIHENIPVSVTKLTLGLQVGFISSHLTADKLFPVNPRAITGPPKMILLLEAKSMPALIIKPRLILVMHMDDFGWNITSNQQGQMFIQNLNRIVSKPNVMPGQTPYCTTKGLPTADREEWSELAIGATTATCTRSETSIPIDLIFQENFPPHTEVWNRLSHRNNCR